jgi:hypothetical protein
MDDGDYGARSFHHSAYRLIFFQSPLIYISQPKVDFTNEGCRVVITNNICVKTCLYNWREIRSGKCNGSEGVNQWDLVSWC